MTEWVSIARHELEALRERAAGSGRDPSSPEREFNRALLESMSDGVVACDANGVLTLFNRAAREWHGADPMRLSSDEWPHHYDLYCADGVTPLPPDEVPLARAFRGEAFVDAGMAIVASGRAARFIVANGGVIADETGRKLGAVVVMRDVTELRRVNAQLRQANEVLEARVRERTGQLDQQYATLRGIVDAAAAPIYSVDRQYRYTSFNRRHAAAMRALHGVRIALGQSLLDGTSDEEERAQARDNLDRALAGETFGEEVFLGEDRRTPHCFRVMYGPIRSGVRVVGVAVVAHDVTERRGAEERLRESEQRYRDIFDNVLDSLYLLEVTPDGSFRNLEVNPAFEKSTGLTREQVLGKTIEETVPAQTASIVNAKYRRCVDAGHPIEEEVALDLPVGRRTFRSTLIPARGPKGRVARLVGISRDITESKLAAQVLDDTVERLNEAQRIAHIGSWELELASRFLWWSDEIFRIFELAPSRFGATYEAFLEAVHPEDRGMVDAAFARSLETRTPYAIEHRLLFPDGRIKHVHEQCQTYFGPEGPVRSVGTVQDITERKRQEGMAAARLNLMQLAASASLEELLEEALNEAESLSSSTVGFFLFVNEDQRSLGLQVWSTRTKADFCGVQGKGKHSPVAEAGVWVDCLQQRRPVIHNDYMALPHRKGVPEGHGAVVRELLIPVQRGDKVWAIVGVGNKAIDYTPEDLEVVSRIAELAWEIAERKRAEEALRRRNRELRAISNCNQALLKASDEQTLLEEVCRIAHKDAGYLLAWVGFAENDSDRTILPVAWAGVDTSTIASARLSWAEDSPHGGSPAATAIQTAQPVYMQNIETNPRMAQWRASAAQQGYRSGSALPLEAEDGSVFGVLVVYSAEIDVPEEERALLEELAGDLAFGIRNLRSRAERARLRESALRDRLTGLHNRRFLEESVEILVSSARRRGVSIGLLMCDLDYFKQVNDEHGHDAGDLVLREASAAIRLAVRTCDIVTRMGGEEFLVVMTDTKTEGLLVAGERIRAAVEALTFRLSKGELRKTVSVGAAEFPVDSEDFWQTVKFADLALYKAKKLGRNQVVKFERSMVADFPD